MAILIFAKDSDNQESSLYRMAANQTIYDANKNWNDDVYDLVTISDEDYDALRKETKSVVSKNGSTVNYLNHGDYTVWLDHELKLIIDKKIEFVKNWLDAGEGSNASKAMAPSVTTYFNWLKNLDPSTLITNPSSDATWNEETLSWSDGSPFTGSIEAYGISQEINVFHPLELL